MACKPLSTQVCSRLLGHLNDGDEGSKSDVLFEGSGGGRAQTEQRTLHDFVGMLVIAMAAALSDCDTIEDIADWGWTKEPWLRQFLVLKNGIPSEPLAKLAIQPNFSVQAVGNGVAGGHF